MKALFSNYFDVYDLDFLTYRAAFLGAVTLMDNTFNTVFGCQPISNHSVDIVIDAGTKYLGGYADCPYGVIVCKRQDWAEEISWFVRVHGQGTIAPALAELALYRLQTADVRMAQSSATAIYLMDTCFDPLLGDKVDQIMAYDRNSSGNAKTREQYKRGNGLFTVVFNETVTEEQRNRFVDESPLCIPAASWGGHVTLAVPLKVDGKQAVRLHAGLEDAPDLTRSFNRGLSHAFTP